MLNLLTQRACFSGLPPSKRICSLDAKCEPPCTPLLRFLATLVLVLLITVFPAGRPVFASCTPAATSGNNTITCHGAGDTIDALAGYDQVNGGAGNDSITGGTGNDTLTGGAGDDTLNLTGSSNAVTVDLGTTGNQIVNSNLTSI